MKSRFHCAGHISHMPKERLPKQHLFGQLKEGHCHQGGPKLQYKDVLKRDFKSCKIDFNRFEHLSKDRAQWISICHSALERFEEDRIEHLQHK